MKIELADGGYDIIEAQIQEIEKLALDGAFSKATPTTQFHQIAAGAKKLRQILRSVLILAPDARAAQRGEGE